MTDEIPDRSPNLPTRAPLDRAALDRVLARAAELQAHEADPGDVMLTEEQLIEVAKEAGLSPHHVRQALAEERTRLALPDDPGLAGRVAGPPVASASRTVRGSPAEVLAALDAWMQREECLQVKRRFGDRITWEARRDFLGSIQRGLNIGGRGYALTRAAEVAATVVPVDEGRVLVRLDADLSGSRTSRLVGGGAAAAAGVAAGSTPLVAGSVLVADPSGVFFIFAGAAAALGAALGLGGGYAIARGHQKVVARAQLALEQILDRLEHGDRVRPSLPSVLSSAAERLLRGTITDLHTRGPWPRSKP